MRVEFSLITLLLATVAARPSPALRAAEAPPGQAKPSAGATEYHVAPHGDDRAAGTAAQPFATPTRAMAAVRALVADGLKSDVRVVFRAGQGAHPLRHRRHHPLRPQPRERRRGQGVSADLPPGDLKRFRPNA